jgi:hypothetical protein
MENNVIISGEFLTKNKRQEIFGKISGKNSMKPENFQRKMIIQNTNIDCCKTNSRINLRTNTLEKISRPNKNNNGFDYSEDFDGFQEINNCKIYINLKCVVGSGGAQTRSLREVYWFIQGQINVLTKEKSGCIYFVNILDGDYAHSCMDKFKYLLENKDENIKSKIYIGDLKSYFEWFDLISKIKS